jgi:hypothetical protein
MSEERRGLVKPSLEKGFGLHGFLNIRDEIA